jgi:alpha-L-fucosidase
MSVSRRRFLTAVGAASVVAPLLDASTLLSAMTSRVAPRVLRPRPTAAQLRWQRDELALFLHFGVNTFTDREWGDGKESPAIFAPDALDCRQWARAARAVGAKALILTAKHHDGFCLWPTATTRHSVVSSPFRGGQGDVVREFTDACRAEGLRAGLYLSPWDRNHPTYGDSPRYNAVYREQLTELLTRYGPIHEVWFDGANGEGPNGKRQVYDWPATWGLVKQLQPDAVIFSDAGPDVRWIGNEIGVAGETNWSSVNPATVPVPGLSGDEVMRSLREGDRYGTVWRPGETDVSIRPGWFWHPAEDAKVRSPENLEQLWFTSVGRNSKLLLNVPPTRAGLLHDTDVRHLALMRARLDAAFGDDVTIDAQRTWSVQDMRRARHEVTFARAAAIGTVDLAEDIAQGQRVAAFSLSARVGGAWTEILRGSTIGYRRAQRIPPITADALRLDITDADEAPLPVSVRAYRA